MVYYRECNSSPWFIYSIRYSCCFLCCTPPNYRVSPPYVHAGLVMCVCLRESTFAGVCQACMTRKKETCSCTFTRVTHHTRSYSVCVCGYFIFSNMQASYRCTSGPAPPASRGSQRRKGREGEACRRRQRGHPRVGRGLPSPSPHGQGAAAVQYVCWTSVGRKTSRQVISPCFIFLPYHKVGRCWLQYENGKVGKLYSLVSDALYRGTRYGRQKG